LDGCQAVGDHKGRPAFHELFQRLLDESFRLTVEGRGSSNNKSWIFTMALAMGEPLSARR
jgi:hypothetical protein